jgi:peroxiredoxin
MSPTTTPDLGQTVHDFTLPDSIGTRRSLADLLAERPLVVVFYRGHW